jgi:hypothetical protein
MQCKWAAEMSAQIFWTRYWSGTDSVLTTCSYETNILHYHVVLIIKWSDGDVDILCIHIPKERNDLTTINVNRKLAKNR